MARPKIDKYTELTKAEMEIMQLLWSSGGATVNDIIAEMKEPKPAYNTVSTIIRILVDKKFVTSRSVGRSHFYMPAVEKESYANNAVGDILNSFFDNSVTNLVSCFAKQENLSKKEIDEIIKLLNSKRDDTIR